VIHLLVGETEDEKQRRIGAAYCRACRQAGKDTDCAACGGGAAVTYRQENQRGG
jgi:hypothetical protein